MEAVSTLEEAAPQNSAQILVYLLDATNFAADRPKLAKELSIRIHEQLETKVRLILPTTNRMDKCIAQLKAKFAAHPSGKKLNAHNGEYLFLSDEAFSTFDAKSPSWAFIWLGAVSGYRKRYGSVFHKLEKLIADGNKKCSVFESLCKTVSDGDSVLQRKWVSSPGLPDSSIKPASPTVGRPSVDLEHFRAKLVSISVSRKTLAPYLRENGTINRLLVCNALIRGYGDQKPKAKTLRDLLKVDFEKLDGDAKKSR